MYRLEKVSKNILLEEPQGSNQFYAANLPLHSDVDHQSC